MPDEGAEVIRSLGRELVSQLAPEELPLYASLVVHLDDGKGGRPWGPSGDQILGFGAGEAMTLLTPALLEFAKCLWDALAAQAVGAAVRGVLRHRHRGPHEEVPQLTAAQLRLVKQAAAEQARRLNFPEGQANVLADAVAGILSVPDTS